MTDSTRRGMRGPSGATSGSTRSDSPSSFGPRAQDVWPILQTGQSRPASPTARAAHTAQKHLGAFAASVTTDEIGPLILLLRSRGADANQGRRPDFAFSMTRQGLLDLQAAISAILAVLPEPKRRGPSSHDIQSVFRETSRRR